MAFQNFVIFSKPCPNRSKRSRKGTLFCKKTKIVTSREFISLARTTSHWIGSAAKRPVDIQLELGAKYLLRANRGANGREQI